MYFPQGNSVDHRPLPGPSLPMHSTDNFSA